jgi:hypothetical protein
MQSAMDDSSANAGIAIVNLNDEVLRTIFEFAEATDPIRRLRTHSMATDHMWHFLMPNRFDLGWVNLTGVSRRWRVILLSMGELWARNIRLLPPAHFDVFLARSGTWPITFLVLFELLNLRMIDFLPKHTQRVGKLT